MRSSSCPQRKEKQVRDPHAIDVATKATGFQWPTSECCRDAAMTLNQPENGAQDANGRRKPSSRTRTPPAGVHRPPSKSSRLTCMILRSSLGSVPSTASISDCLRKGSSIVCRSLSSEMMPWRRAYWRTRQVERSAGHSAFWDWQTAAPRCATAATTVGSGNCSSTAPRVPQRRSARP